MDLTLDVETIGTEDPLIIAEIAAAITAPKTMTKWETIEKWTLEDKPALVEAAIHKTGFDGGQGRIICIGYAFDDDNPQSITGENEAVMIESFYDEINAYNRNKSMLTVVGHNVAAFDLPFLWKRSVVNRIHPCSVIPFKAKPWSDHIADTMLLWDSNFANRVSLDKLCRILGVQSSKEKMRGADVWAYYKAGRISEIAEYCMEDVEATRTCYRRMNT